MPPAKAQLLLLPVFPAVARKLKGPLVAKLPLATPRLAMQLAAQLRVARPQRLPLNPEKHRSSQPSTGRARYLLKRRNNSVSSRLVPRLKLRAIKLVKQRRINLMLQIAKVQVPQAKKVTNRTRLIKGRAQAFGRK